MTVVSKGEVELKQRLCGQGEAWERSLFLPANPWRLGDFEALRRVYSSENEMQ